MTILISKRTISNPLQFLSLWNETHSYITLKQHSNINEFGDKTRITRIASLWGNYLFKKTILFISSFHFRSKYQRLPKYWQKQKDRYLLYSLHFFFRKDLWKNENEDESRISGWIFAIFLMNPSGFALPNLLLPSEAATVQSVHRPKEQFAQFLSNSTFLFTLRSDWVQSYGMQGK